jgi:hypothetical protein
LPDAKTLNGTAKIVGNASLRNYTLHAFLQSANYVTLPP